MNTPRRTVRISDDLWQPASELAAQNGETMSDVVRRGIEDYLRAAGVVIGTVLVIIGLSACGSADGPQDAPSVALSGDQADAGTQTPEPPAASSAAESEAAADCWKAGSSEDVEWMAKVGDVAESALAQYNLYLTLPDASEACDEVSREVLDARQDEEERLASLLADS